MMKINRKIDCLGLYCPEPIYRTSRALDEMEKGQVLKVITDDPVAEEDLTRLAIRLGYDLLDISKDDEILTIVIKK